MRSTGLRQRLGIIAIAASLASPLAAPRAGAAPSAAPADAIAAKRAEAAALAAELEQLATTVSRLAEEHNRARLQADEVEAKAVAAQAALDRTRQDHRAARDLLRTQAVDAYVRGGNVALESAVASGSDASELSLRRHYVQQVVERQRDAIDALAAAKAELADRKAALDEARGRARDALAKVASSRSAAEAATAEQRAALARAQGELAALVRAEAERRAAEEARRAAAELAARRAREEQQRRAAASTPSRGATGSAPSGGTAPAPSSGAAAAVAEARGQIGKPYEWGAAGPDSFDCSGLTMWAWRAGGKSLPHSSRSQYSATARVALADLRPGDLLFYGNPIHHVGIYVGDGQMIEASETGTPVRYASITRRDYAGAGRVL